MNERPRWIMPVLVVLAFAATGISLMLASYHQSAGKDPWALFSLACNAEEGGCADVLASRWAVGPAGIPVATFGAIYFGALGLWYLIVGRPNRSGRSWQAFPLGLNAAGALVSLYLLSVMLMGLGEVCWWCTLTHLINFGMLYLGWRLFWRLYQEPREGDESGQAHPPARLGFAGLLLVLAWAALCIQGLAVSNLRNSAREATEYARTFYEDADLQSYLLQRKQPSTEIPIRPDDAIRGNPAAPHTVVVFSDFQCPACRGFAQFFETEVLPALGDRVRIVYKHFPLEPDCNPVLTQVVHASACEASEAAEAARALGGSDAFWRMHDRLFRDQDTLNQAPWSALAQEAGVDPARLSEMMAANAHRARIQEDAELGRRLQVQSTPTVYLDGRKMEDWRRLDLWKELVE